MKRIIAALLAGIFLLSFTSCADENVNYIESINDALKISAWVLNKDLDENGSWTENEERRGQGQWTESDGRIVESSESGVFALERLKLNDVRMMAPFNYNMGENLNIYIEYNGIVMVEPEDEYIRLWISDKTPSETVHWKSRDHNIALNGYVNICPLDEYPSGYTIRNDIQKTKREYYFNVNAYKSIDAASEEAPTIRARLKLEVLEDKGLSPKHDSFGNYVGVEMSRFMSVELVSYEYSDIYKILEEMTEDEEE